MPTESAKRCLGLQLVVLMQSSGLTRTWLGLLVAPALGGRSAGIPAPPEHKNNVQVMKAHGVKRFFHFTDISNLDSIREFR